MSNLQTHTPVLGEAELRLLDSNEIDAVAGGATYDEAWANFVAGGAAIGAGAAQLVASAWTGIALTPGLILGSSGLGGIGKIS
ncbi:hypothetical protein C5L14_03025 [Labrys okinawensis]|uniref:Bacteriocin n=1 Tax=Labrys okinawensis TaxID=346911 RepID=A0A2S9QJQ3_9HYPH|nr:hypothetical protein [Labrys okinawensis]PRH89550.1 hypothetical protein C5L14_03025 [Labrys okinawensis]